MNDLNFLKAVIQHVIDGIIIIDKTGQIIYANPAADELFGYQSGELCSLNVDYLMPVQARISHNRSIDVYKETGYAKIINKGREIVALRKDGSSFPARLSVSEVLFKQQAVYAGVIHDLSLEKEIEEQQRQYTSELETIVEKRTTFLKNIVQTLEQAKEEVNASLNKEKEVNKMKTRFVSIASHEFRTPLSRIQLSASLIERYFERLDKGKIFEHLAKIKGAVTDLTGILNDFLSIERIESGSVNIHRVIFNLGALIKEIAAEMSLLKKANQQIIVNDDIDTIDVLLDNQLIRHCLINLISNAIKYSGEDGIIHINAQLVKGACTISIQDNGMGIPTEDCDSIFQPFFRAGNTTDIDGTGLGLNIVKRYVELMNGRISFNTSLRNGTVFEMKFPAQ
ncbi:PAS domain-containing sensor histidine kinase [Mucilaginibacter gossypii]|uniref:histidine kinase n=1 Tax=Mucilaginibacter gossypii TaxID=551996 RepID=A0A1G7U3K5_9SPHI|nr:PAS domain-containing sensor histidine kinase [Mucilaginibacter gossypii]SDG41629.1 PAS domain S-box-containing protein [Mucilaginibacter gossypii]